MPGIAPDLVGLLACPADGEPLTAVTEDWLACAREHQYPIVGGVPILLLDDLKPTLPDVFTATHEALSSNPISVGQDADAFVTQWMVRTNGNLYRHMDVLPRLPIARFPVRS